MIIQKLTMENFRQYYGRQTIEFAKSDGNQIVTVICGENGRGKTGIYRAIMLALFGDVKLDQDAKEADIYLANVKAVEEQNCDGHGAFCSVKLCFTYHGDTHTIERKYFAMKDAAGKQKEQLHEVRLVNETSEEEWRSEKDIREIIQQIVDERVKHYFFFDGGERIERLTRVSAQQKQEVTLGIKNLLKIDQVLKSRDVLKKVLSKVNKELEKNSTGDYKKAHREMVNLQERLDKMEHSEEVLEQKKIENNARLAQIDEALSAFDSMKADMKDREVLEMKLGAD
ncbi:ATPase [Gracilibacillus boraciitolerans JCM 21714]|uniref:Nuclease SbcCD subunit C n=1 Tax=Gracilibacillus boraciitolerans JCM 21714 TaxID=1298598 RepID=W4VD26_9BACI|nr:AAA family ATPase [Gracilibacillus boraciitolerans]GAE91081.1 ATPase [Gracilibacillus boraciitolerans JCM 21714]